MKVMCPWTRAPPAKSAPWDATATSRAAAHNYDNMKTAVNTVFVRKEREYNERFLQMCSHHLVEPVACMPGAGWEKGQVENQVGTVRRRLFVPRPRRRSYRELNTWLVEQCIREAKRLRHPTMKDKTVWEVFEEERAYLIAYRGAFDGFHAMPTKVSPTLLVRFDNNYYSVQARAASRAVDVCAYADRVVIRQDGETVGEHPRRFDRGKVSYNAWHYVPVLQRKPGALRNGAPFKDWQLPKTDESGACAAVSAPRRGPPDGDGPCGGARGWARRGGVGLCRSARVRHVQRRCGAQRAGPAS